MSVCRFTTLMLFFVKKVDRNWLRLNKSTSSDRPRIKMTREERERKTNYNIKVERKEERGRMVSCLCFSVLVIVIVYVTNPLRCGHLFHPWHQIRDMVKTDAKSTYFPWDGLKLWIPQKLFCTLSLKECLHLIYFSLSLNFVVRHKARFSRYNDASDGTGIKPHFVFFFCIVT